VGASKGPARFLRQLWLLRTAPFAIPAAKPHHFSSNKPRLKTSDFVDQLPSSHPTWERGWWGHLRALRAAKAPAGWVSSGQAYKASAEAHHISPIPGWHQAGLLLPVMNIFMSYRLAVTQSLSFSRHRLTMLAALCHAALAAPTQHPGARGDPPAPLPQDLHPAAAPKPSPRPSPHCRHSQKPAEPRGSSSHAGEHPWGLLPSRRFSPSPLSLAYFILPYFLASVEATGRHHGLLEACAGRSTAVGTGAANPAARVRAPTEDTFETEGLHKS